MSLLVCACICLLLLCACFLLLLGFDEFDERLHQFAFVFEDDGHCSLCLAYLCLLPCLLADRGELAEATPYTPEHGEYWNGERGARADEVDADERDVR